MGYEVSISNLRKNTDIVNKELYEEGDCKYFLVGDFVTLKMAKLFAKTLAEYLRIGESEDDNTEISIWNTSNGTKLKYNPKSSKHNKNQKSFKAIEMRGIRT